jgi:hypothetical protein
MSFSQHQEFTFFGNVLKIYENRTLGKIPTLYDSAKILSCNRNPNYTNYWERCVKMPLEFDSTLLMLIGCYEIKGTQIFYLDLEGRLVTKFSSPSYISKFFSFEEVHIYEQKGDMIEVSRECSGNNYVSSWLQFTLMNAMKHHQEVEEDHQKQQSKIITEEILQLSL